MTETAPNITQVMYTRSALYNALYSGMTLTDVCEAVKFANDCEDFDTAVNQLAMTVPDEDTNGPTLEINGEGED